MPARFRYKPETIRYRDGGEIGAVGPWLVDHRYTKQSDLPAGALLASPSYFFCFRGDPEKPPRPQ